ncbi:MAG: MraY family glycosyltransferase [Planctomycetaceae bacterium]
MLIFVLACTLPAFVVSVLTTAIVRKCAEGWGLVDNPNARKVHKIPMPLGGGIGIWLGVVLPLAIAQLLLSNSMTRGWVSDFVPAGVSLEGMQERSKLLWMILGGGTVLSVMGLIDDLKNLPWKPRLAIQFLVAVGLVWAGVSASVFVPIPIVGQAITVVWLLVLINAFNFLDNMDGLTSGIALVGACVFAVVMLFSIGEPRWLVGGVMLILAGALAGFLVFNWSPASIFMGDSGSYFIGLIMGSMTIVGTFYSENQSRHVILAPLFVLAVPLYDFCSVLLIRIREGRSPFHADKKHFSHRLVEIGFKPSRAVLTIHLATLTTGLAALLLYEVEGWMGAALISALVFCVLAIIAILETVGRTAASRAVESDSD